MKDERNNHLSGKAYRLCSDIKWGNHSGSALFFTSISIHSVSAEQEVTAESETDNLSSLDDDIIFVVVSLVIAFMLSLFGTFLGYIAFKDNSVMRKYLEDGIVVNAEVVSYEIVRGGKHEGTGDSSDAEYLVCVEYNQKLNDYQEARIAKTFKVKKGEITHTYPSNIPLVELYVLSEEPMSGYPKGQVEKACSCGRRMVTLVLVCFNFFFALICAEVAIVALPIDGYDNLFLYGVFIILGMVMIQIPFIYLCLDNYCTKSLHHEYFYSGNRMPIIEDSSSLSSGSDGYLMQSSKHCTI